MYFLLKMVIFYCYVRLPKGIHLVLTKIPKIQSFQPFPAISWPFFKPVQIHQILPGKPGNLHQPFAASVSVRTVAVVGWPSQDHQRSAEYPDKFWNSVSWNFNEAGISKKIFKAKQFPNENETDQSEVTQFLSNKSFFLCCLHHHGSCATDSCFGQFIPRALGMVVPL